MLNDPRGAQKGAHPQDSIPQSVRTQLLALGIPTSEHTSEALAARFPRELNVAAASLAAEDLARVIVHLAKYGIIAAPAAKIGTSIKKVAPGWHFCQFYQDFEQLLEMVAPYIAEGLNNGEGCLWVMPTLVGIGAARDALARFLNDVDTCLASGQLELLHHRDWYLDPSGRFKSFEEISGALLDRQDRALAKGFRFLRAAGDAGWVSGTEESKAFIDYEMKVNAALGQTKVAAVCTFRADVTADELVAIVTAHQDAIYKNQLRESARLP